MGRLSMRKISEVFRQRFELKRSYRDVARSLNISISTVSDYLARARAAGLSWPFSDGLTEQALYDKLFLPVGKSKVDRHHPDWEVIHRELRKKGMTLRLLWREYRDQHQRGLGYSQFCNYYQRYVKNITPVMRQTHKAGEKSFVDYAGMKMPWLDPVTGEIHEAEIFVGCLGASQFIFTEATATQQLPDWIQSHIHMFEYFGGVSEIVVPDNLKSGVTSAHRYDPDINTNYQHLGEHYGIAIIPARAAEPKDKAKVESAVSIVERQILAPLRHYTFTSIGEMNAAIAKRLVKLNDQPFQKMKTSRRELFESIDKPALKPLPPTRYQYAEWKRAKIHVDYHFVFDDHYYSVPYQHSRHVVELRATAKTIECFYQSQRITTHTRSYKKYGFTTLSEHMPKAHQEQAKYSLSHIESWAKKIGQQTVSFIEHMMASRAFPQQAYRACYGLLRLSQRYGEDRLEKACAKALVIRATRYQQVESILKNQLEEVPVHQATAIQLSAHDNIRGAKYYK
ncbi:MAG: IS21 family transposase [Gammaproteobacteria bacterium]|nr:IS21 family transposase [Gammaproteobacteria bacterium]MCW5584411.1 IS21 family transposase [Gammaproteobacteria bacterium]